MPGPTLTPLASTGRDCAIAVAPALLPTIHRHGLAPLDLLPNWTTYEQSDRMTPPFSSWQLTVKVPGGRSQALALLDGIRDDDWLDMQGSMSGGQRGTCVPLELGPIDSVRTAMESGEAGTNKWTASIAGRGWAKVLQDTTVSTWQRMSGLGYSGSILTPQLAEQFTRRLADGVAEGVIGRTSPASLLSELVQFILRDPVTRRAGQWLIPDSLAATFGALPLSGVLDLLMLGAGIVQAGDRQWGVDGTVWRGISLMSGIRGTLWQICEAFQSNPALIELWPGWTTRAGIDGRTHLLPTIYYRDRPFSRIPSGTDIVSDWDALPTTRIPWLNVAGLNLGKSGAERFNVGMVAPSIAEAQMEQAVTAVNPDLPYVDNASVLRHGTRGWFVEDSLTPPRGDFISTRSKALTDFLVAAYGEVADLFNGSLDLRGVLVSPTILGTRLVLTSNPPTKDLVEFYVEGLDTRGHVAPDGTITIGQTVQVTRGRGLQ